MKLHRLLIALAAVLVFAQRAPAHTLDLWQEKADPQRDFVLEAAQNARAHDELQAFLGAPLSVPCVRIPKTAMPFRDSREITNVYTGRALLSSYRLESCVRWQVGEGYENRTPLVILACSFFGHGIHVRIALDPAFTTVIQEFSATLPSRTYVEPGYDGITDFAGFSGVYEAQREAKLAQTIVPVAPDEEDFYRSPFSVYVEVTMLGGTIAGAGAYTAKIDGDGFVVVLEDVNGDGIVSPGGEQSFNGASVATVFHWSESSIP